MISLENILSKSNKQIQSFSCLEIKIFKKYKQLIFKIILSSFESSFLPRAYIKSSFLPRAYIKFLL